MLDGLVTLPTALYALGLYVVSFAVRRLSEALFPTLSAKTPCSSTERVWEGVVLPTLPAVLGALFAALVKTYPYPEVVSGSPALRVLYGLAIGWFAAWEYKVLKFLLKKKWNIPFPDDTVPPRRSPDEVEVTLPSDPPVPRV